MSDVERFLLKYSMVSNVALLAFLFWLFVANERKHVSIDRQYSSLDNAATTMNTD